MSLARDTIRLMGVKLQGDRVLWGGHVYTLHAVYTLWISLSIEPGMNTLIDRSTHELRKSDRTDVDWELCRR